METKDVEIEYSWEERYYHVRDSFCAFWNAALNFISRRLGPEAVDEHVMEIMGKDVLGKTAFADLKEGADAKTLLGYYVPHHIMIGSDVRVVKVEEDQVIVDIVKCGTKSFVVEKFGADKAEHYCRHCEILPLWEQIGWRAEVDLSHAQEVGGQNIGCRRTLTRNKV